MVDLSQIESEMAAIRTSDPEFLAAFVAQKWVRVMCDHSADSIWAKDGGACDSTWLPVTPHLILQIRLWQQVYERFETWKDIHSQSGFVKFAKHGFLIALEMKRQLPDWTIIYHDERRQAPRATAQELRDIRNEMVGLSELEKAFAAGQIYIDRYRPWFEYEITPDVLATGCPPDNYPK